MASGLDPVHFLYSCCFFELENNADVGGEKVSVTQKDLQTNPNTFDTPLWSCPVLLTGDAVEGVVEVLAE